MTLTTAQALAITQRLHTRLDARRKRLKIYDDMYRGIQPLEFASEHWREFHGNRYRGFSDNWCAPVANAPSERLRVDGIRLPTESGTGPGRELTRDENLLWGSWLDQELDVQSSQGFLDTLVSTRSFVLVWGDDDDEPQVTWEDANQVIVEYDPENPRKSRYSLKTWRDEKVEYATLYTDDEVWKWQRTSSDVAVMNGQTESGLMVVSMGGSTSTGGWNPRQPNSDDTWPLDNPMGEQPVTEFPNRPMLRAEPISEIAGTIAMQNAVNLLWAYLFGAADFASLPGRVITGMEMPKMPVLDANGEIIGEKDVPLEKLQRDRFLWLDDAEAKIAEFTAAKLDVFTDVIEVAVGHIAAQTRTPPHYLASAKGLSNLSGDALKAAETGLVKKTEEAQLFLTPPVRSVFAKMALVRDQKDLAKAAARGTVLWKNAEMRSDAQLVDQLQKLRSMTFPLEYLAERLGLTPPEVERVMKMRAAEIAADPLAFANLNGTGVEKPPAPES